MSVKQADSVDRTSPPASLRKDEPSANNQYAEPTVPVLRKYSHGFFSPELAPMRKAYLKVMYIMVLMTVAVMWVSLPAYWGSLAHAASYTDKFQGWLVDLDGGELGASLKTAFQSNIDAKTHHKLSWSIPDPSRFANALAVQEGVINEKVWLAVVVHPGSSAALISARENGNSSFDPTQSVSLYITSGRNEIATGTYILPFAQILLGQGLNAFSTSFASKYLAAQGGNATAMQGISRAPQTIAEPVVYTMTDLRPFSAPVASALILVGNIYIIFFAFIATMAGYALRQPLEPYLTLRQLFALRIIAPMIAYIPISFSYAMLSLPFNVPFDAHYSNAGAGFFAYFIFAYLGMGALGMATETMVSLITPNGMSYFLTPFIVVNVSVATLPISQQPWFFNYGAAFPFYNIAQATRTLIFNTHSHLGLNAGVLVAWIVFSSITVCLASWFLRGREKKADHAAMTQARA